MSRYIAALIRHGEYHQLPNTPSTHQPFPLSQAGKSQAGKAAKEIMEMVDSQGWRLHQIIDCSHLLRAWQTAQNLVDHLVNDSHRITEFKELAERSVGIAGNLTISQIEQVINDDPRYHKLPENWKSNSSVCLPFAGAESLMQAGQRVAEHLIKRMQALRIQKEGYNLKLFIGHGAAFRHAACHLGILKFDQLTRLSMYHCRPVYLELLEDNSWQQVGGKCNKGDATLKNSITFNFRKFLSGD